MEQGWVVRVYLTMSRATRNILSTSATTMNNSRAPVGYSSSASSLSEPGSGVAASSLGTPCVACSKVLFSAFSSTRSGDVDGARVDPWSKSLVSPFGSRRRGLGGCSGLPGAATRLWFGDTILEYLLTDRLDQYLVVGSDDGRTPRRMHLNRSGTNWEDSSARWLGLNISTEDASEDR